MYITIRFRWLVFSVLLYLLVFQYAMAEKQIFEGWLENPNGGGILPIWMELEISNKGDAEGWYCYRIDGDKIMVSGTVSDDEYYLGVHGTSGKKKETLAFHKDADSLAGEWLKGTLSLSVTLFEVAPNQESFIPLNVKTDFSKRIKKNIDTVLDIEYMMVRKGLASIKVYHTRNSGSRDWVSYHTVDLQKNTEINLLEYIDANAFGSLKIMSDTYAEQMAREQLEILTKEDIIEMLQCGFSKDEDFHLDAIILYPNRTGITLFYEDLFGLSEACKLYAFPVEYSIPVSLFKSCIKKGSVLFRYFN